MAVSCKAYLLLQSLEYDILTANTEPMFLFVMPYKDMYCTVCKEHAADFSCTVKVFKQDGIIKVHEAHPTLT